MTEPAYRTRFIPTYYCPGTFFSEDTSREVSAPLFAVAVKEGPDEEHFCKVEASV